MACCGQDKQAKKNEVSPMNGSSKSDLSDVSDDDRSGIRGVFSDFAEKTSVSGIPFIRDSTSKIVTGIWSVLLIAAIGAMIYHLYSLFARYFDYTKHAEIDMSFAVLTFPAITICNVNIMRYSKLNNASQEIQDLVASIKEKYDTVLAADDYTDLNNIDTTNLTIDEYDPQLGDYYQGVDDSAPSDVDTSVFGKAERKFQDLFSYMDIETQRYTGHQIDDLIVSCTFGGAACRNFRNFTQTTTASYGNCYTVENNKFIARRSGPDGGLELVLFLEMDEYIPGITSGQGAQIVIHEQGTYPFPAEGISISAGDQTVIGIKQMKINRLGDPYNECTQPEDTIASKYSYTRNLCQKKCLLLKIIQTCKCYYQEYQSLNSILNVSSTTKPCKTAEQNKCRANVTAKFNDEENSCNCYNPCSESVYEQSISYRQWPNKAMAKYLISQVCQNKTALCSLLWNKTMEELQYNFLKLNIYFQDLNYEERTEQPNYEFTSLLADIGGTIGLWIGLSILSFCEVFDLLLRLVHYALCQGSRRRRAEDKPNEKEKKENENDKCGDETLSEVCEIGWYGETCAVQCHCAENNACTDEGFCIDTASRCMKGFFGGTCQIIDMAQAAVSSMPLLIDGDPDSCQEDTTIKRLHLRLDVPVYFIFLRLVVLEEEWFNDPIEVKFVTIKGVKADCMNATTYLFLENALDVYCNVIDLVREIEVTWTHYRILCSVNVDGGSNVVLRLPGVDPDIFKTVDGDMSVLPERCWSKIGDSTISWTIDLQNYHLIYMVVITGRPDEAGDKMRDFRLSLMEEDKVVAEMTDTLETRGFGNQHVFYFNPDFDVTKIKIYYKDEENQSRELHICEFEAFGWCAAGVYGDQCEKICPSHCARNLCDEYGCFWCIEGYTGPTCNKVNSNTTSNEEGGTSKNGTSSTTQPTPNGSLQTDKVINLVFIGLHIAFGTTIVAVSLTCICLRIRDYKSDRASTIFSLAPPSLSGSFTTLQRSVRALNSQPSNTIVEQELRHPTPPPRQSPRL
ncbi:degenerin unc-8 [Biomphalaria pfeifferi]|uniref:Degenerin unc-8 n=1 Tax=Biomphalaria pfeifferi TaxID=112525 RepID=A0AAD8F9W8_BIOPF|nr:degenerin unc-8 [Biomphalaria pfeifferi]